MRLRVRIDGHEHEVALEDARVVVDGQNFRPRVEDEGSGYRVVLGKRTHTIHITEQGIEIDGAPLAVHVEAVPASAGAVKHGAAAGPLHPPLPGRVVAIKVKAGDRVKAGQCLVVLEAMKMQNEIAAPGEAVVREVRAKEGQLVEPKDVLLVLSEP